MSEENTLTNSTRAVLSPEALEDIVRELGSRGFRVLGPVVRDGAIVYDELESAHDLPIGWTDRQDGGTYRLERRPDDARFGYAVGPHSWKRFLFPPRVRLWHARRSGVRCARRVEEEPVDETPLAFVGVRSLRAPVRSISRTRVFIGGTHVDERLRRPPSTAPSSSRSTASSRAAPASAPRWEPARGSKAGYDLVLTELLDGEHRFLVEAGSRARTRRSSPSSAAPGRRPARTSRRPTRRSTWPRSRMGRTMDTHDIRDLLARNLDHPRWDDVADALPHLRQLHPRLPDLLLLGGRGRDRPGRQARRSAGASGTPVSPSTTRIIHGGSIRSSAKLALPAVDDPQARHVVRPVRDARAASAAAAASRGVPSGSTSRRRSRLSARTRPRA